MSIIDVYEAVIRYNIGETVEATQAEVDAGTDIHTLLRDGLTAPLAEVGNRFSEGSLFIPEMLVAAKAVQAGLDILRPLLAKTDIESIGNIVIGTVKGDLHDIGKNMVGMILEGAGLSVTDLGVDVSPESFFMAANENNADIIAISSLLTTTMPALQNTVSYLMEKGIKGKIMIGGVPVTQAFANEIDADVYAEDAPGAVKVALRLIRN